MDDDAGLSLDAELRRAAELLGATAPAPSQAHDLRRVDELLDVGARELAYVDLVTLAEELGSASDVWTCLQRAQRAMGLDGHDEDLGRYVRSVDSHVALQSPSGPVPPPPAGHVVVLEGSARSGHLSAANAPFGSMEVRVESVQLRVWRFDREILRRGEGGIVLHRGRWSTSVRFDFDDDRQSSIIFKTSRRDLPQATLESFGWHDAIAAGASMER